MRKLIAIVGIVSMLTCSTTVKLLAYTGTNPWYRGDGNPNFKKPDPIRPVTQKPATTTQQKVETPKSAEAAKTNDQKKDAAEAGQSTTEASQNPVQKK